MALVRSLSSQPAPQVTPARQLAEFDDIATCLVVDPYLGFTTHKMCARFRHNKGRFDDLRRILIQFQQDRDYERAYDALVVKSNWSRSYFARKSKGQAEAFKEHVSDSTPPFYHSVRGGCRLMRADRCSCFCERAGDRFRP